MSCNIQYPKQAQDDLAAIYGYIAYVDRSKGT